MKARLLCTLLFLATSAIGHAAVPRIDDYDSDTRAARPPWFVNDNESLHHDDSALDNPLCKDGLLQTPPSATDFHAFFAGRPATRVVYRGDGHQLPGGKSTFGNDLIVAQHESIHDDRYARLNFSSPPTNIIPGPSTSAWFSSSVMLTSTCLARAPKHFVNRRGSNTELNKAYGLIQPASDSPRSHAPRGNAYGKPK